MIGNCWWDSERHTLFLESFEMSIGQIDWNNYVVHELPNIDLLVFIYWVYERPKNFIHPMQVPRKASIPSFKLIYPRKFCLGPIQHRSCPFYSNARILQWVWQNDVKCFTISCIVRNLDLKNHSSSLSFLVKMKFLRFKWKSEKEHERKKKHYW